jgi:peptide/nickel transport system permease protein
MMPDLAATAPALSARRRNRFGLSVPVVIAAVIVLVIAVCTVLGPLIAPQDPGAQDLLLSASPPTGGHLFGTDQLGRDVFSRIIVGARTAIIGPIIIALGSMIISNILGLLAGYWGGLTDSLIMRWVDLAYSMPGLLVTIVISGTLGGGYTLAVITLMILFSPFDTRIVRGVVLEQRSLPYVESSRTLGLSHMRIMAREIWPNILPFVVANTFLEFAYAIVALSGLSFLGFGVSPGAADWGRMLSDNEGLLYTNAASALAPGAMIVITAAAMNILGDWLFERVSDRGRVR